MLGPKSGYRTLGSQTLGYQVWGTMVPGMKGPKVEALNSTLVGGTKWDPDVRTQVPGRKYGDKYPCVEKSTVGTLQHSFKSIDEGR